MLMLLAPLKVLLGETSFQNHSNLNLVFSGQANSLKLFLIFLNFFSRMKSSFE